MATGFDGQTVCVVGGTAGMGLAIAREAALDGAHVTVAGRSAEKAAEVAARNGMGVDGRALDVTEPRSVERFFAALGPIDHLVVSAVNGAVEALGRALAVELAPVRVNVRFPGLIRGTDAYASMPPRAQEAMYAAAAGRLPARLVGGADSVARIAVSLLASPYVTGAVFDVDGGGLVG